ncbi:MAG: zinc metalloprotease [Ferruginibacter sp.]
MKKILLLLATGAFAMTSCTKTSLEPGDESLSGEKTAESLLQRNCSSFEVLQEQLSTNPSLRNKLDDIERFTKDVIDNPDAHRLVNGIIEIPVVFNVIYNTSTENISNAQLQSQVDVLNEDYSATNSDYSTSTPFDNVKAGNIGIRFVLDAVVRKQSTKKSWKTDDAMKSTSTGGINATSPTTKLNIWVVNKMVSQGRTILGYAQFPGGAAATDGVVLGYNFTGRTGVLSAPFNKGRTATHEVGHWLNLRHIWGDATCGNDLVGDTPLHNTSNYGCPAAGHRSTCSGTPVEMTMNYMDYTDDACMYMFSAGQKSRMLAIFASGGPRNSFAQP